MDHGVELQKYDSTGLVSSLPIFSRHCPTGSATSSCVQRATLRQVVPNPTGGILATWDLIQGFASERHMTKIDANGVMTEQVVDPTTFIGVVGDRDVAYVWVNGVGKAMDIATWSPNFEFTGLPLKALDNKGVISHDGATLRVYYPTGGLQSSTAVPAHYTSSVVKQSEWISVNQDYAIQGQPLRAIAGPAEIEVRESFGQSSGRGAAVYQSCVADGPPYSDDWKGIANGTNALFRFLGDNWAITERNFSIDSRLPIRKAFQDWEDANGISGLQITFEEGGSTGAVHLNLKRAFVGIDAETGRRKGGFTAVERDDIASDGTIPGAAIVFSDSVQMVGHWDEWLKFALHEIGHVLGLDDIEKGRNGTSVMNILSGPRDTQGFISTVVTRCDREKAHSAPLSPWPRP